MTEGGDRRIYLDYAAAPPLDPAVRRAMLPYLGAAFGNPSSLHSFGQEAQATVDRARETVARLLGVSFRDVVFTGSATEANNLALRGVVAQRRAEYSLQHWASPRRSRGALALAPSGSEMCCQEYSARLAPPKVVVSAVEHESVLETARDMERTGEVELVVVPVDREGVVDLAALERALDERTILVSVQYVNNETGVVQPIPEISNIIRNFRNSKHEILNSKCRFYRASSTKSGQIQNPKFETQSSTSDFAAMYPLLHVDAVQAFNYLDCALPDLGADLVTLSAHKCYGPKGVGILCINKQTTNNKQRNHNGYTLAPIITGGGQEFGIRSGTENVASIVGCAAALALSVERREKDAARIGRLAALFFNELKRKIPGVEINGVPSGQCLGSSTSATRKSNFRTQRAPHILNLALPKESKACTLELVVALDQQGVAVSTGSACASRATAPSHVLRAMGMPDERIRRSFRVSFGRMTTRGEVVEAVRRTASIVGGSTSEARG